MGELGNMGCRPGLAGLAGGGLGGVGSIGGLVSYAAQAGGRLSPIDHTNSTISLGVFRQPLTIFFNSHSLSRFRTNY
jgi:hypothetical protein